MSKERKKFDDLWLLYTLGKVKKKEYIVELEQMLIDSFSKLERIEAVDLDEIAKSLNFLGENSFNDFCILEQTQTAIKNIENLIDTLKE